jgi:hypothetical protein
MKTALTIIALLFSTTLLQAQYLRIDSFKVGAKGYVEGGRDGTTVKIIKVIDENKLLLRVADLKTGDEVRHIILNVPTKGLTEESLVTWGDLIGMDGKKNRMVEVTSTEKYRGKTYLMVYPITTGKKEATSSK